MDAWKHCPNVENPADLPSRGMNLSDLIEELCCFNGPTWLSIYPRIEGSCLSLRIYSVLPPQMILKLKKKQEAISFMTNDHHPLNILLECEKNSSFQRIIRVIALVFKFMSVLKSMLQDLSRLYKHWNNSWRLTPSSIHTGWRSIRVQYK